MYSKILRVCTMPLVAVITVSFPSISFGEYYISNASPTDAIIIKKASNLRYCKSGIRKTIGKLKVSENIWVVYYSYINDKGRQDADK